MVTGRDSTALRDGTPFDLAHTAGCAMRAIAGCLLLVHGTRAKLVLPLIAAHSGNDKCPRRSTISSAPALATFARQTQV